MLYCRSHLRAETEASWPGLFRRYFPDLVRRTAEHVDKILRGTKPADIPVEQSARSNLTINLRTARLLPSLHATADAVIE